MKITKTVNCNQRYYLDEFNIMNFESFMNTIRVFNLAKIDLYSQKYRLKYSNDGALTTIKEGMYLKNEYGLSAYFQSAVCTAANGQLSSQAELQKFYKQCYEADIKTRQEKIAKTKEELVRKQGVKESLVTYAKTGRWVKPYSKCQLKVCGSYVQGPGIKGKEDVGVYERKIESRIRKLKSKIKYLEYGLQRKQQKIDNLTTKAPKRIIFGSKKLFSKKDDKNTDLNSWHEEFEFKRTSSMTLPGRKDGKYCNFLCRFIEGNLLVTNTDGTETVFKDFRLARFQDEFLNYFRASKETRKPLCYNFNLKKDSRGRVYVIVSATMELENKYVNHSTETGCVAIDLNYDHVALADIDEDGNLLESKVIHFDITNKSSGAITDTIGRVMSEVGAYVESKNKVLIMEKIDTSKSKHGMRYGNSIRKQRAGVFAYSKMTGCLYNQAYKRSFDIIQINPAYTSQMGKFLYMKQYGLSIHQAAAYCIGLKGLNQIDRLKPDSRLLALLSTGMLDKLPSPIDMYSLCMIWRYISTAFSKVPKHSFYRGIPYEVLTTRKRPSLRTLSNAMCSWTAVR